MRDKLSTFLQKVQRKVDEVIKSSGHGYITIHVQNGKITRIESNTSELVGGDSH